MENPLRKEVREEEDQFEPKDDQTGLYPSHRAMIKEGAGNQLELEPDEFKIIERNGDGEYAH